MCTFQATITLSPGAGVGPRSLIDLGKLVKVKGLDILNAPVLCGPWEGFMGAISPSDVAGFTNGLHVSAYT